MKVNKNGSPAYFIKLNNWDLEMLWKCWLVFCKPSLLSYLGDWCTFLFFPACHQLPLTDICSWQMNGFPHYAWHNVSKQLWATKKHDKYFYSDINSSLRLVSKGCDRRVFHLQNLLKTLFVFSNGIGLWSGSILIHSFSFPTHHLGVLFQ